MALIPVTHNISESVLDLGKKFPVNTWLIFNTLIADDFNCVVFKCLQIITPSQPPVRFCSDWCVHYCHLTSVGPLANFTVHGPPASGTQWGGGGDEVTQLSVRPTQHRFCSLGVSRTQLTWGAFLVTPFMGTERPWRPAWVHMERAP